MSGINYVIVSPVRNEAAYLPNTIAAIANQSICPRRWIIVDDGSTDDTGRIADEAAAKYDWITVVHRADRGFRRAGVSVMEAFYDGFVCVAQESWDYLIKLDGDVTFRPDYFELCFAQFQANLRLGIGGGLVCNIVNGRTEEESKVDPLFHVRGATKIYRSQCWREIGGLFRVTGWDTLDEIKANMLGWDTRTFRDIEIIHHRPAGKAYGAWSNWVKNGRANYFSGYHPLFMVLKCVSRFFKKPFGVAGLGLGVGFWGGYLKRLPQVDDPQLIKYLRREQLKRMFFRSSLWNH